MAPFPSSKAIPTGWSRHHAKAAAGGMNATVKVGVKTGEDTSNDDVVPTFSTDYDGPARIQAINDARVTDKAGEEVRGRLYLVQLYMDAEGSDHPNVTTVGARVHVESAINDARLVGQDLWVVDPQLGSERFTRDLMCTDNQTDTVPSP